MSDTKDVQEQQGALSKPLVVAKNAVPANLLLVMRERECTMRFEELDFDDRYFIRARHPYEKDDDVTRAGAPMDVPASAFSEKGKSMTVEMGIRPNAAFVAKCLAQITGFRLPSVTKDGEVDVEFKPDNNGDNYPNRDTYRYMLANPVLREHVENFLDWVAGRDNEGAQAFEEAKNAQPQLLADM